MKLATSRMTRKIVLAAFALGSLCAAAPALAQTAPHATALVTFPITALGNCNSKAECKIYCDDPTHKDACYAFAQTYGLMSAAQIATARKLLSQVGPGGCQGEACKAYCNDSAHEQLCVAFAQQNGFISKDEADKRMKILNLSSSTMPFPPMASSSTRPFIKNVPPPPPPQSGGQSSSVFFGILHFLGL